MAAKKVIFGIFVLFTAALVIGIAVYFSKSPYKTALMTINELLTENNELKNAITNLTEEEQIGYAKVLFQQKIDGILYTTISFVETARDDNFKKIFESEYTVRGDVFYFDVLIVKFGNNMVTNGRAKSLYIWRRIFGEKMAPEDGYLIEEPGTEPIRYKGLLKALPAEHSELFWANIWDLANDPNRLKEYDIQAIYGDALYQKLIKERIYIFKIAPTGLFYIETMPEI